MWIEPANMINLKIEGKLFRDIRFYEDYIENSDPLWLAYNEYGLMCVIKAPNFETAYDVLLDSMPTVAEEDLHMAYNFPTDSLFQEFSRLHRDNPDLAYKIIDTHNRMCEESGNTGLTVDLNTAGITASEDFPMLDEAYTYQPNATKTGIVFIGHYLHLKELILPKRKGK